MARFFRFDAERGSSSRGGGGGARFCGDDVGVPRELVSSDDVRELVSVGIKPPPPPLPLPPPPPLVGEFEEVRVRRAIRIGDDAA